MKKRIILGVFALVLLATAGHGVNRSMNSYADLSDLALANVEALAQGENDLCPNVGLTEMGVIVTDGIQNIKKQFGN